jgi:flagellar biosynthesis protein FlhB
MKKSDIYEIAIKILGIYFLVTIAQLMIGSFAYLSAMLFNENLASQDMLYAGVSLFVFIIMILLDLCFIFKTHVIVKMICKSSDFEQDVQFTVSKKSVYEIALVLMGMITIVLAFPDFIYKMWNYVQTLQMSIQNKSSLVTSGIKIIVGLVAVIYSTAIANFLVKEKAVDKVE